MKVKKKKKQYGRKLLVKSVVHIDVNL